MQNIALYVVTVAIWGSTWIMIRFQLGVVPPQVSVVYRFALAAIALAIFAWLSKRRLRIAPAHYSGIVLQGFFMFSANYYFVYVGTGYLTTGLVAVLFTTLVLLNVINERIFFGTAIAPVTIVAGVMCVVGIGMLFWPQVSELSLADDTVKGIALVFCGAVMASIGNMAAILNTRRKLPVVAVNAHSMAIGAVLSATYALLASQPFIFERSASYVGSLLFLAIPGTAIAFGCYLRLIERIGATKAAYTSVMLPVVALLISTIFENYEWTASAFIGVAIALAGNALALASKRPRAPSADAAT